MKVSVKASAEKHRRDELDTVISEVAVEPICCCTGSVVGATQKEGGCNTLLQMGEVLVTCVQFSFSFFLNPFCLKLVGI